MSERRAGRSTRRARARRTSRSACGGWRLAAGGWRRADDGKPALPLFSRCCVRTVSPTRAGDSLRCREWRWRRRFVAAGGAGRVWGWLARRGRALAGARAVGDVARRQTPARAGAAHPASLRGHQHPEQPRAQHPAPQTSGAPRKSSAQHAAARIRSSPAHPSPIPRTASPDSAPLAARCLSAASGMSLRVVRRLQRAARAKQAERNPLACSPPACRTPCANSWPPESAISPPHPTPLHPTPTVPPRHNRNARRTTAPAHKYPETARHCRFRSFSGQSSRKRLSTAIPRPKPLRTSACSTASCPSRTILACIPGRSSHSRTPNHRTPTQPDNPPPQLPVSDHKPPAHHVQRYEKAEDPPPPDCCFSLAFPIALICRCTAHPATPPPPPQPPQPPPATVPNSSRLARTSTGHHHQAALSLRRALSLRCSEVGARCTVLHARLDLSLLRPVVSSPTAVP